MARITLKHEPLDMVLARYPMNATCIVPADTCEEQIRQLAGDIQYDAVVIMSADMSNRKSYVGEIGDVVLTLEVHNRVIRFVTKCEESEQKSIMVYRPVRYANPTTERHYRRIVACRNDFVDRWRLLGYGELGQSEVRIDLCLPGYRGREYLHGYLRMIILCLSRAGAFGDGNIADMLHVPSIRITYSPTSCVDCQHKKYSKRGRNYCSRVRSCPKATAFVSIKPYALEIPIEHSMYNKRTSDLIPAWLKEDNT